MLQLGDRTPGAISADCVHPLIREAERGIVIPPRLFLYLIFNTPFVSCSAMAWYINTYKLPPTLYVEGLLYQNLKAFLDEIPLFGDTIKNAPFADAEVFDALRLKLPECPPACCEIEIFVPVVGEEITEVSCEISQSSCRTELVKDGSDNKLDAGSELRKSGSPVVAEKLLREETLIVPAPVENVLEVFLILFRKTPVKEANEEESKSIILLCDCGVAASPVITPESILNVVPLPERVMGEIPG